MMSNVSGRGGMNFFRSSNFVHSFHFFVSHFLARFQSRFGVVLDCDLLGGASGFCKPPI